MAHPASMPESGPILLVGATGMLGRPVAARLRQEGFAVRVLSRDPARARSTLGDGFDFVAGDVRDPGSLHRAMAGCRGVHLNLRGGTAAEAEAVEARGAANAAAAAAEAGVGRITYLSGAGIEAADPGLLPVRIKQAAEAALRGGGVPWTIFRATHFMESLDLFVRGDTAALLGRQTLRYHYLAAEDYAGQVARAWRAPGAARKALTLLGPEAFTMEEALTRYIALARPDLRLRHVPLLVPKLVARLTRNAELAMVAALFDSFRRIPETGSRDEADALVGPATTRLDQWCRRRAGAA